MPVKIRLMRIGAKKRPFYRVVAVDERKKRTGEYLELLGTYNPLTEPKDIKLRQDRIDQWVKNGAVLSDGFLRIIGKAPQRPPRKPKKTQPVKPEATPAPVKEEAVESTETPDETAAKVVTESTTPETESTTSETAEQSISEPETPAETTSEPETPEAEPAPKPEK